MTHQEVGALFCMFVKPSMEEVNVYWMNEKGMTEGF